MSYEAKGYTDLRKWVSFIPHLDHLCGLIPMILDIGFVSEFGSTKIGNMSHIGGNVDGNIVKIGKFMDMERELQISIWNSRIS